jgi:uncharacterized protein YecT (DUF1311 family)
MRLLLICAMAMMLGAGRAHADPCTDVDKDYSARGVAECASYNFNKSDASLNEVYQKVVRHLKESGRDLKPLITAERAWIAERDARCDQKAKEYDLIDATGDGAIIDCKTGWTNARIATLKDYLQ